MYTPLSLGSEDCVVRTFHAFCRELLQEFGLELGIDVHFRTLTQVPRARAQRLFSACAVNLPPALSPADVVCVLRRSTQAQQAIFLTDNLVALPLKRYKPTGDPVAFAHNLLDYFGRLHGAPLTAS
jgi:hypothetical protein